MQRGKTSQECYETVRNVLGQEYVTRTNPYNYKTYQGNKNSKGKGKYSVEADRGVGDHIKYSLDTAEADTEELTAERKKEIFEKSKNEYNLWKAVS